MVNISEMSGDSSGVSSTDQLLPPRRNRVGALLSAYYNVEDPAADAFESVGGVGGVSSSTPGNSNQQHCRSSLCQKDGGISTIADNGPTDLDGPHFDVHIYFHELIQRTRLKDLLKRNNELSDDIKRLDGDMQMLVYENYNKFISATDTIKKMKTDVEGMEGEMSRLTNSMDTIQTCSDRLNEVLAARSSKIEELVSIRQIMSKIQHIFQLPNTMRQYIGENLPEESIRLYLYCAPFLEKHCKMQRMNEVLREASQLNESAKSNLRSKLRDRPSALLSAKTSAAPPAGGRPTPQSFCTVREAVQITQVLLDSKDSPEKLLKLFLDNRIAFLTSILDEIFDQESLKDAVAVTTEAKHYSEEAAASAGSAASSATMSLDVRTAETRDANKQQSNLIVVACERVAQRFVSPLCESFDGAQKLFLPHQEGLSDFNVTLSVAVSCLLDDLFNRCLFLVQKGCPSAPALVNGVNTLRAALRRLHAVFPQLLADLFVKFIDKMTTVWVRLTFCACYKRVVEYLKELYTACRNSPVDEVLERVGNAEHAILLHGCLTLTECEPIVTRLLINDKTATQRLLQEIVFLTDMFFEVFILCADVLCRGTPTCVLMTSAIASKSSVGFCSDIALRIRRLLADADIKWCGMFALTLLRICRHFEVKGIQKLVSVASDFFQSFPTASFMVSASSITRDRSGAAAVQRMRNAAQCCLTSYVFHCGQKVGTLLRKSIQMLDWNVSSPPEDVRGVVETVLQEIHSSDIQLSRILGDPRKPQTADQHHRRMARIFGGRRTHMEMEMERLFARKAATFCLVPFNRGAALMGILRITFRSVIEDVREETFGKYGVQQLQVDCAFFSEILREFVDHEDATTLDGLLDEIVASAYMRCMDSSSDQSSADILMDLAVVEGICDQKRAQFIFRDD